MTEEDVSDVLSDVSDISYTSDLDTEPQSIHIDISDGSPLNSDDFIVVQYNVDSILAEGRIDELTRVSQTLNLNVLIINESHLDETIPDNLLLIPSFHPPVRRDRLVNGRYGGGNLVYISESLTYEQKFENQLDNFEHIWVDITSNNKIYTINVLYRPPKHSTSEHELFLSNSETLLNCLQNYNAYKKIIMSDLNFGNCFCKYPILSQKPLDSVAPELFLSFNFHQIIDIPTRVTYDTTSLVDLCFVNSFDFLTCHGTLPRIADHDGTFVCFSSIKVKNKPFTKTKFDYKNMDEEGLVKFIQQFDFETNIFSKPRQQQADIYYDFLKNAFDKFVPSKQVVVRPNEPDWSNAYTRLLQRKKNRNYSFFKKASSDYLNAMSSPQTPEVVVTRLLKKKISTSEKARQSANESKYANTRAKNTFFNSVNSTMHNPNISAKKKFSILKNLMKTQKMSSIPPLKENDNIVQDAKEKADILNNHFANKSQVNGENDPPPVCPKRDVTSPLSNINTSPIEVAKIIREMKKSHQSHCGVPGKFLSLISTPISFSLSRLFNNFFEDGLFPEIFKIAHITAIWKGSGLKSSKLQYRPISLLPTLSKVFESIIHNRLLSHYEENNIISERQAAYMKGDSTINQLIYLIHLIKASWSKGCITRGIFLDVHAAFDKVWHAGLIAKLESIQVEGKCLNLFISYLSNRKQVVVVDGVKSEISNVKAGVPQGSRLGPILFILYIEDIKDDLECEILIYADDTTLIAVGKDPSETAEMLNRDLLKISEWAQKWKIIFAPNKSHDIIFSKKTFVNCPSLFLNDTLIERVTQHRHLGVYLTPTLDWSVHLHQTCLKANWKLSVLRSVKYLDRSTLDVLYKLTVRSVIDYSLPLYFGNLKQTELLRLKKLQYRGAKIVTSALHFTSQEKLEAELGWESIQTRYEFLGLSFFHKFVHHMTRPLIRKFLPEYVPNTNNRSAGKLKEFPYTGKEMANSFIPNFTKKWNRLDSSVKVEKDITKFKDMLKLKLKPKKYKHFSRGPKKGNRLLTQLRVGRSFLNAHRHAIGLSDSPICSCYFPHETPKHYLLQCFLYTTERQTLFSRVEQLLPNFRKFGLTKQFETLLHGTQTDNKDYFHVNLQLQNLVQNFITSTKRFDTPQAI